MTLTPQDEVVRICRDLIRFDTTNWGQGKSKGELAAALYVVEQLAEVGIEAQIYESEPGRANVVARIPGANPDRGALCVHGHLDVVPADPADWEVDPFAAEERDGFIWGRGAVDMKDMDAMILACVRHLARTNTVPDRDLVIAFFADEEDGGGFGAQWMVTEHPECFEGVTEAISEVGGYSVTIADRDNQPRRRYLIQTAEKGILWLKITAHGTAGHGSVPAADNPIVRLAAAIERIAAHEWPVEFIPSVRGLLDEVSGLTGVGYSETDMEPLLDRLGGVAGFVRGSLADTANVTMLEAGYKHNVVPQQATAYVDCRYLPGHEDTLMATMRELAGERVDIEVVRYGIALEAEFDTPLVAAMVAALRAEDPDAEVVSYALSGGTDNKALARLGVAGYGFAPLRLPADIEFAPMFHGINERVPVESLHFGTAVLWRFITSA